MKSMALKEKILYFLILFFTSTLIYPAFKVLNITAIVSLTIFSITYNPLKEKWLLLKERQYLIWMFAFFAWIVISICLSVNRHKGLSFLDPRLSLFYLPLCIGTLQLSKKYKELVLLGLAVLITVFALICFLHGILRSNFFEHSEFLFNDSLTEVLGQQSIYISLLVNISIYIFGYFVLFKKPMYKVWMVVAMLFLFGFSYLLASRIMMGVLYAVSFGFCFYYIIQKKKYLEGVTLLMGILIGVFLIFKFFPQTLNRFKELGYTQYNYQSEGKESHYNMQVDSTQWNGANFRLAAWKCGWQLFKANPITGVHLGDKKDRLFEVYQQKHFDFAIRTNKNVHNNYLDILYSLGLIGLILFLTGWIILPLAKAIQFSDGLAALVILTFAAAWVTEIYFDRNLGGMLTGFFIPFVLTDKLKKERQP